MPSYHYNYLKLFCCVCLAAVSSCRLGQQSADHEAYFKKAIQHAYHMPADKMSRQAVPYVDSVYRNFKGNISLGDLAQQYDFKSNYYLYFVSDYARAMLYADSMLYVLKPYSSEKKYSLAYATACLNKGNVLYSQKYFSSAYGWYYQGKSSLHMQDSCSYNKYMSKFSASLGQVCYDQGKYKQSIRFWHEALNKMTCENSYDAFYRKQGWYDNIGLCYRNLKRPDDAIAYFDKAIALLKTGEAIYPRKKNFIQMALGLVYGNQGDAYLQKAMYARAEERYQQSISINSQKNFIAGDARLSRLKLAAMYVNLSRFADARKQLDAVEPILDKKYRPEMLRWLSTNADYYRNAPNGNAIVAYSYLSRYVSLKDSVQADQRVLAGADFNDEFTRLQQESTLKAESKKNRLNNLLIYSTMLVLVLIVALTGSYLTRKGVTQPAAIPQKQDGDYREKEVYLNWYDEL